jgi:flagellar biosynthetic protein FliP
MSEHTRQKDLELFLSYTGAEQPDSIEEIPLTIMVPAFALSEIKTAFQIGFMIFIPFLVIDMVVASVLMSMGMMMLPPVMISLPFKILLFVLVDGWYLVMKSLLQSF